MNTLFLQDLENEAILRIQKFYQIAKKLDYPIVLGFSGGKDSQVIYSLCKKANIPFTACFNHCFESNTTLNFIKEYYPQVIWRRIVKEGFIQNIWVNHNSLLPTSQIAYCCRDYKHNPKFIDSASIVGVRRQESQKRIKSMPLEIKNKTLFKRDKALFSEYFDDNCIGLGSPGKIQLKPIVDWYEEDIIMYHMKENLPRNPEYNTQKRVGCIVCPKCHLKENFDSLMKSPKLIDAFIKAREKRNDIDWYITSDNKDYSNNKVEYICRWLNYSFQPFSRKEQNLFEQIYRRYKQIH